MTNEEKAKEIASKYERWNQEDDESFGAYNGAMEMAEWLLQNIQIVKLHKAYNHDLFENHKFLCLEEQKKPILKRIIMILVSIIMRQ